MLGELARKETEFIRFRRLRLTHNEFENIKLIGRGAFGEVRRFARISWRTPRPKTLKILANPISPREWRDTRLRVRGSKWQFSPLFGRDLPLRPQRSSHYSPFSLSETSLLARRPYLTPLRCCPSLATTLFCDLLETVVCHDSCIHPGHPLPFHAFANPNMHSLIIFITIMCLPTTLAMASNFVTLPSPLDLLYSQVRLVRMKGTGEVFAMKRLKKTDILSKEQVRHISYFSVTWESCLVCFWCKI